jgi:urocanate hydratase
LDEVFFVYLLFFRQPEMLVELGSDQTSLHNPFNGGYYPVGLSFEESNRLMATDPAKFKYVINDFGP